MFNNSKEAGQWTHPCQNCGTPVDAFDHNFCPNCKEILLAKVLGPDYKPKKKKDPNDPHYYDDVDWRKFQANVKEAKDSRTVLKKRADELEAITGLIETPIEHKFEDGCTVRRLTSNGDYYRDGALMQLCAYTYMGNEDGQGLRRCSICHWPKVGQHPDGSGPCKSCKGLGVGTGKGWGPFPDNLEENRDTFRPIEAGGHPGFKARPHLYQGEVILTIRDKDNIPNAIFTQRPAKHYDPWDGPLSYRMFNNGSARGQRGKPKLHETQHALEYWLAKRPKELESFTHWDYRQWSAAGVKKELDKMRKIGHVKIAEPPMQNQLNPQIQAEYQYMRQRDMERGGVEDPWVDRGDNGINCSNCGWNGPIVPGCPQCGKLFGNNDFAQTGNGPYDVNKIGAYEGPQIYCPNCGSNDTEATGNEENLDDEILREERECHNCGRYFQWNMDGHFEGKPYRYIHENGKTRRVEGAIDSGPVDPLEEGYWSQKPIRCPHCDGNMRDFIPDLGSSSLLCKNCGFTMKGSKTASLEVSVEQCPHCNEPLWTGGAFGTTSACGNCGLKLPKPKNEGDGLFFNQSTMEVHKSRDCGRRSDFSPKMLRVSPQQADHLVGQKGAFLCANCGVSRQQNIISNVEFLMEERNKIATSPTSETVARCPMCGATISMGSAVLNGPVCPSCGFSLAGPQKK